jgi:hypothetical protein
VGGQADSLINCIHSLKIYLPARDMRMSVLETSSRVFGFATLGSVLSPRRRRPGSRRAELDLRACACLRARRLCKVAPSIGARERNFGRARAGEVPTPRGRGGRRCNFPKSRTTVRAGTVNSCEGWYCAHRRTGGQIARPFDSNRRRDCSACARENARRAAESLGCVAAEHPFTPDLHLIYT